MLEKLIEQFKIYESLGVKIKVLNLTKKEFEKKVLSNNSRLREEYHENVFNDIIKQFKLYLKNIKDKDDDSAEDILESINFKIDRYLKEISRIILYVFKDTSLSELQLAEKCINHIINQLSDDDVETEHFQDFYKMFGKDESLLNKSSEITNKKNLKDVNLSFPKNRGLREKMHFVNLNYNEPSVTTINSDPEMEIPIMYQNSGMMEQIHKETVNEFKNYKW